MIEEKKMEQKPTVGRQVHYYAKETFWSQNVGDVGLDKDERERAKAFRGPYAATIVFVHADDGFVNLHILFPGVCYCTDRNSELVTHVPFSEDERISERWVWPPRI